MITIKGEANRVINEYQLCLDTLDCDMNKVTADHQLKGLHIVK